ncbi:uncharacterized protein [Dermacentor albipictus]|uniref:uncharacterized protein isoform X2 n=1 Tax=Dermacentor albipictus TaxID=60249 RepID=UPI0038FCB7C8
MESMIRDQVVFGVHNPKLRETLLKVKDLTLAKTEQICKAAELSSQQNEAWAQAEKQVASVKKRPFKCTKCNRSHERSRCPAFGKACFVCGGTNHFAACCKKGSTVSEVVNVQNTFDILDVKTCKVRSSTDWIVNAKVAGQDAFLKVDTGSQANLLPYSVYRKCKGMQSLKPSSSILRSYSGNAISHFGVASLPVTIKNQAGSFDFFIVKKGHQAILGLSASEALGLVARSVDAVNASAADEILQEFPQLFQGTGCVARQYRMVLRTGSIPVVQPARRVPLTLTRTTAGGAGPHGTSRHHHESDRTNGLGKQLLLADMLSRSTPINHPADTSDSTEEIEVHAVGAVSDLVRFQARDI